MSSLLLHKAQRLPEGGTEGQMYAATLRTRKSRTRGKAIGTDLHVSDLRDWTTRLSRNPCGCRRYMERDQEARQKDLYHWDKQRQWGWEELQIRVSRVS